MKPFLAKLKTLRHDITFRTMLPWMLAAIIISVISYRYPVITTSPTAPTPGLERGMMYVERKDSRYCVGDVANFRLPGMKPNYRRPLAAGAGQQVMITVSGYTVDGVPSPMPDGWAEAAQQPPVTAIPAGHFWVPNARFAPDSKVNAWPHTLVPVDTIKTRVTRIALSQNLTRTGEVLPREETRCEG